MSDRLLPQADQAVVDLTKLQGYCLDPDHPRGRHKARVFRSALGLRPPDAEWLRDAILTSLATTPARREAAGRHGERWRADLALTRGDRTAIVRTLWLLPDAGGPPRLITCFVV